MKRCSLRLWLPAMLVAGLIRGAEEPPAIRRATRAEWPIRWYLPPGEGPVMGEQNGWFVTPHEILPGRFTFGGRVENATDDSFEMTPSSVWGRYRFRITRSGPADRPTPDLRPRKTVPVRELHFADLAKLPSESTLLLSGRITEISADRRTLVAEIDFRDGPLSCRLERAHSEERGVSPDLRSLRYGPHWQHTMDIYYPASRGDDPLPVIFYIHGGGWGALDKQNAQRHVPRWTDLGFAVVSINYRFVSNADDYPAMSPPVAAPLFDAARALQHLRHRSTELGLDPDRIAVTGGSAGGATSCWLALHDDMADPESPDPIARQSTRVTCAFPVQAQTSLDPRQMRQWIPRITYGAHAFFTGRYGRRGKEGFDHFLAHRDEVLPWIEEFSPYRWASRDDPPFLHIYGGQKDILPALNAGHATHHPKFGEHLHRRLQQLGVESHYWADDVRCENERYHGPEGVARFVCDKMGVARHRWVSLFNGRDLSGWRAVGPETWRVEDGAIVGETRTGAYGWLVSQKEYGDFVLRLRFRWESGNSGVQFRSWLVGDHVHGYQADIAPAQPRITGMLYDEGERGLLQRAAPEADVALRREGWNDYEISALGDHIQLFINGVKTVDCRDRRTARGILALQIHSGKGVRVRWKDLRILEVPPGVDWKPLFDGATLAGWKKLGPETWRVEAGAIVGETLRGCFKTRSVGPRPSEAVRGKERERGDTTESIVEFESTPHRAAAAGRSQDGVLKQPLGEEWGWLVTERSYSDFILRLRFQWESGNSGVQFRSWLEGDRMHGLQADIFPARAGVTGSLYEMNGRGGIAPPPAEVESIVDATGWNDYEISALGERLRLFVNGLQTVDFNDEGGRREGLIGFQIHRGQKVRLRWKDIRILDLGPLPGGER